MVPSAHCFDGGMIMILLALYLGFCRHSLNFPETKLPPVSDIIILGNPYSAKKTLHVSIKLFSINFLPF